jgi:DNA phosphorothioation-dependent restriction protein DptG
MYPIAEHLKVRNNFLESYLPLRNKNNDFDWPLVTGLALGHALKLQTKQYEVDQFRNDCKEHFIKILDEPEFWHVLARMYFSSEDVFRISPVFMLFRAQYSGKSKNSLGSANWRLGTLFSSLLGGCSFDARLGEKLNFVEKEILGVLEEKLIKLDKSPFGIEQPYLPYLAQVFQQDIAFLAKHPQYLLQEMGNTLKLYAFTYCAQLALNLRGWHSGEPKSKPLYFLLDTEKASSERDQVKKYGYKLFAQESERLFPILSAIEILQKEDVKRPLWQIYQDVLNYHNHSQILFQLNEYLQEFIKNRSLPERAPAEDIDDAFKQLLNLAWEQFKDEKTERAGVNKRYVKELEAQICSDFIQSRGRAGRVLVLNKDQLLLLTNLAIGLNEKLRFHELMSAFEERGFYLDNQSRQTLIAFYERLGNIERMSDSGDAVYVRKTV